jgi:predicted dehydrogenase
MKGMVNSPDAPGDDPCTVTGIRAIDEPGEAFVEVEITVRCSGASLWKDRPGEHPWFGEFSHRVRLVWNQGQMGVDPDGWIRIEVPRGQLEDFIRAVRQAARDTDAVYQALLARRREYALREAQAQRERQADPAKRARLAEDQARIDTVLAETEQ